MQISRVALPIAALAALVVPATARALKNDRPCVLRRHWSVAAENSYAVVARLPSPVRALPGNRLSAPDSIYDYCSRAKGRWVRMTPNPSDPSYAEVKALRLAGRYVAFETQAGLSTAAFLWDTSTGQHQFRDVYLVFDAAAGPEYVIPRSDPDFLLSPNGVAARIESITGNHSPIPPTGGVEAITLSGAVELDSASSPSDLAKLQIYACAAGCARDTAVVAWTNRGDQRYAEITG